MDVELTKTRERVAIDWRPFSGATMVTVCAWCERFLGAKETEPMVTHGICTPCAARQRWADAPVIVVSRERADLRPVLEHLLHGEPAIRVVVDRRAGDRRRDASAPDAAGERRHATDRRQRPADAHLF
jgi:hypothetical protein